METRLVARLRRSRKVRLGKRHLPLRRHTPFVYIPPRPFGSNKIPPVASCMSPAPIDNRSDQQLVDAINQGDMSAFDALYFRHRDWTMRLALRFTGHHDDALDVLQETFAYLARKFPGFVLTAAITTFLYPAVRNFSIALRRKRLRSSGGEDLLPLVPDSSGTTADEAALIRNEWSKKLASLSQEHLEVLLMRFVDGMTLPEIATALELPQGTVKSRLHYAIQGAKQLKWD